MRDAAVRPQNFYKHNGCLPFKLLYVLKGEKKMQKSTSKFSAKLIWFVLVLLLLASCNAPESTPLPTVVVPPTLAPPPTIPPTPAPPTVQLVSGSSEIKVIIGENIDIGFLANSDLGISFVELKKDSINGQSIASYGSPDAQQGEKHLETSLNWIPDKLGEYSLYLTGYDTEKRSSAPVTISITVLPRPTVITSGTVELWDGASYDFVTNEIKTSVSDGDLYIKKNASLGYSVWASNSNQGGGLHLFDMSDDYVHETILNILNDPEMFSQIIDSTQKPFHAYEIPIDGVAGLYIYKRSQAPGEYILFLGDLGLNPDGVVLDYVVFEMP